MGGWKGTYLFSLWYLSWLASQSIYDISIFQATGVQLTCNNMEFNEVLGFLFIFQKILYLEKQSNRDLFQCRLYKKKRLIFFLLSSVVTFWNYVFYPEATWWNLKKVETSPVFSSDHTVPLCPCMSSRCLQTCLDVSGRCYLHVSLSVLVWVFFLFSFFFPH